MWPVRRMIVLLWHALVSILLSEMKGIKFDAGDFVVCSTPGRVLGPD
jgi:hypothetical protein